MSDKDNPFGGMGGQYSANVSTAPPNRSAPDGQAGAPLAVKDVTTASFTADVIQESRKQPVLVDFWAPWCGPCKQLQPVLEKVVAAAGGAVKLVKMNIDEHPSIAGQLGIQSIPAVIAFKNGQPVDGFMGAVPESQIRDFIQSSSARMAAAAGRRGACRGRRRRARQATCRPPPSFTTPYCSRQPDNVDALGGLADILFEAGDVAGAEELLARVPDDKKDVAAIAGVRAKIALADQAASLGDPAELERRLAANPKDHQARFDLAMIQNAQGKRQEAADNLLAIVKADRTWNDDGARAQLLKLFEAWGMTDEVTLAARRKLSSLLFS